LSLLAIPDELTEIRATFRSFIEREVRPAEESHREEINETGTFEGVKAERRRFQKRSAELGFWAMHMPEEVGGAGLGALGQVLLHEENSRHGLVLAALDGLLPVVSGPSPVYLACSDEQRERILGPLVRGELFTCFALTEPEAGSDASALRTTAVPDGDDWVINGRKHFITAGDVADIALVFAVTDRSKGARGGITAFLVPTDSPGFSVSRLQRTMSPFQNPAELTFTEVKVQASNVMGEIGQGFYAAVRGINGARLQIAGQALGVAGYLLERTIDYAKNRTAFGRPIGSNQYVQGMVVDSFADLEQARLLVYQCAAEVDAGAGGRQEGALAKLVATEMVARVADRAIQVHGGNGAMTEMGIEAWTRDVRLMRLYEGTSELLRVNVAKMMGL
jgi:alkylation response protein AidB-like acyl-CoA dehydrogenase